MDSVFLTALAVFFQVQLFSGVGFVFLGNVVLGIAKTAFESQ